MLADLFLPESGHAMETTRRVPRPRFRLLDVLVRSTYGPSADEPRR